MPHLPDALAGIPLNVSFIPVHGCIHFCSFCADSSGKKISIIPFPHIRTSVLSFPSPFNRVALYNACDALAYRWRDGRKRYTVLDIIELFKRRGCAEILLSSPGIWRDDVNEKVLHEISLDNKIMLMLSFNREHAIYPEKMENFYWTAKKILNHRKLTIRLVYCSIGEREVLLSELKRMFGKEILFAGLLKNGIVLETVPALPLGRAKALYFQNAHSDPRWNHRVENMILNMFRQEREIRELEFIANASYADFLQHAAVQFSGMFIVIFMPSEHGGEVLLKVTDMEKIKRTRGASIATLFRFDQTIKKFIHKNVDGTISALNCLIVDSSRVALSDFIRFADDKVLPHEKQSCARLFAAITASNIFNEKCQLNDSMKMIILNKPYLLYYRKALEAIMGTKNFSPQLIQRLFPVITKYFQKKGIVI